MDPLILGGTALTPSVFLKPDGNFEIAGRSIMEDPASFFIPINQWLDNYLLNPSPETVIGIKMELVNTASLKCIIDVLIRLNNAFMQDKKVSAIWYYEVNDLEMREIGYDLTGFIEMPIAYKEVNP